MSIPGVRVLSRLAHGGFGTVFSGEELASGRPVAIKVANPEQPLAASLLRHEAEALQRVGPPFVPEVFSVGTLSSGEAFLVMERIEAPTLADLLVEAAGPLPEAVFARVAAGMLVAVSAVHRHGRLHGDLKPENFFVLPGQPSVKVIDFGTCMAPLEAEARPKDTAMLGTPEYMAPEQCAHGMALGYGVDVYALGVNFYEMAAGRPPFLGDPGDVKAAHVNLRPPRPSTWAEVPPGLEELVLRCLAKDPSRRFPDLDAVAKALGDALGTERTQLRKVSEAGPAPAKAASNRQKRTLGLLFFESARPLGQVRAELAKFGGQLASAAGTRFVAAFGHELGENPARLAAIAAGSFVRREICGGALVDLAAISVTTKADGSVTYFSPLFTRKEQFPAAATPGVQVTAAASLLLPEFECRPLPDEPARFQLHQTHDRTRVSSAATTGRASLLVGRTKELKELAEVAERAAATTAPALATLTSEAGLGKSHLADALAQELGRLEFAVFSVRALEVLEGESDATLRELLRLALQLPAERPDDGGQAVISERLGADVGKDAWVAVALACGWLEPHSPPVKAMAAVPGALRSSMVSALAMALRRRSREKKLAVLLDDAHLADDALLDALEFACLSEARSPLCVFAFARPKFLKSRPQFGERSANAFQGTLGPLSPEDAALLCRQVILPVRDVPASAVQLLVERTHGSPQLMVELVRGLRSQGIVRQSNKSGAWYLATDELAKLPDLPLLQWAASRELEALPADLAAHARLATVMGGDFTLHEITDTLEVLDRQGHGALFPLDATVGTYQLVERGIFTKTAGGRFSFRNRMLQDVVYQGVSDELRKLCHRAAFESFRKSEKPGAAEHLPRIAFHAAQSGLRAEALESYLLLADRAQSRHAYFEAEQMFTHALAQMDEGDAGRKISVLKGRGLMRYRLQRYDDALQDFGEARRLAREVGDRITEIEVLLDEATALDWSEDFRRSEELVHQAQELTPSSAEPLLLARLKMGLARSLWRFSKDTEAAALFDEAAQLAEQLGDPAYETYVISLLANGYVLSSLGRLDEAEQRFSRVIPLCQERGDKLHLATAVGNRLLLWINRNDKERLLQDLQLILDLAREMGNPRLEQQAEYYLGLYLFWLAQHEEAQVHARRAVEIEDRRFGAMARSESAILLARIHVAARNPAAAREILADIRKRQQLAREKGQREAELLPAEEVFIALLDVLTRESTAEEKAQLIERARGCLTSQDFTEVLETFGSQALREGRLPAAVSAYEEALKLATSAPSLMTPRIREGYEQVRRASVVTPAA